MSDYKLVIEAGKTEKQYFRDIWRYRELFGFLAWRDILVRYKQTVIGVAWAIIRPLMTMVVFSFIFGKLAKFPSDGVPYPLLVYSAMLPWNFFASSLSESAGSLLGNANLLSKVYFPRLILPVSGVVVSFIDFLVSFIILVGLMAWYKYPPPITILFLPLLLFVAFFAAVGPGLLLASLNVKFRDFRYVVPFIVQIGLYVSPVGFSSSVVPEKWRFLYSLNPMVGVIDGFRWAITGQAVHFYWQGFMLSMILIFSLCIFGVWYFRRMERTFADVI